MNNSDRFFIVVQHEDGKIRSGGWSSLKLPNLNEIGRDNDQPTSDFAPDRKWDDRNLLPVLDNYLQMMESYRNFIALMISITHDLSEKIVNGRLLKFLENHGTLVEENCNQEFKTYSVDISLYRSYILMTEDAISSYKGAVHLPEVLLIGMVSVYDAFLASFLEKVISRKPELVFGSEKTVTYAEMLKFNSLEDVKRQLISKEVENIIRASHVDHIEWIERKLKVDIKGSLDVWKDFIEICERRNLLTHTGGVVSSQYISVCKENKIDCSSLSLGDRLTIGQSYYKNAVNVFYEIGIKLVHIVIRKLFREDLDLSDRGLIELGYDLNLKRRYNLACKILEFSSRQKNHASERNRRMMLVNLASSYSQCNKHEQAIKIIENEDWSASDISFKIVTSALLGNIDDLVNLMELSGSSGPITASDYQSWPVFNRVRLDSRFVDTFERVFGRPMITEVKGVLAEDLKSEE